MLLKSLKLKDFRQFLGEQTVSFSTDLEKNVTIIMGQNGAGKTSFAQAFRWCLYGDTDFSDEILLSRIVSQKMFPGEDNEVEATLELIHSDIHYSITRKQKYKKAQDGRINSAGLSAFSISYKEKDGNTCYVPNLDTQFKMKEILPSDLSRYFFFDGERIGNMGKDVRSGKGKEFREAVKSLLGLNAFTSALKHLKENTYSVIGQYNKAYSGAANSDIVRIASEIDVLTADISQINSRLEEIDEMDSVSQDKVEALKARIEKNNSSVELSNERDALKTKMQCLEVSYKNKVILLLQDFNKNAYFYFPRKMMSDALLSLQNAEKLDKGIPDIHARTIDFIMKRGKCICGSHIEIGNDCFNALNQLREFIPPKSIGNLISEFTNSCEDKVKSTETFMDNFNDKFRSIREYENDKDEIATRLTKINELLNGMEDVGSLNRDLLSYEKALSQSKDDRDILNQQKGQKESDKLKKEEQRSELAKGNAKNAKIEVYISYAKHLYETLKEQYAQQERKTRTQLAETINEIFKKIYDGGFSLSLDDKYNIELFADGYTSKEDYIETSTAQSISIIFAFISGVIQMARKNQSSPENGLTNTEPYPLVMDAPLSAFDTTRIKSVCDVLPKVAEQVIIFIKDTDGGIAEQHLGAKIGKKYSFSKSSEFETNLMEVL